MVNATEDYSSDTPSAKDQGLLLAKVVSHLDSGYGGALEVELLRPGGGSGREGELRKVTYMSPFYGVTPINGATGSPNDYNNTQQSYGMWMIPPDPGVTVVVFFPNGNSKAGFWIGCVPDENMNFMIPGIPATQNNVEGSTADSQGRTGRAPTGEYNKSISENNKPGDPEALQKPQHPLTSVLDNQGLLLDDIRGITTSSSRREAPSMVFGISTPGPLDKRDGARTGPVGKAEWLIPNALLSRLGGSTFVMDDGDAAFTRKTDAQSGPPDYSSVEAGETDGDPTIPHNELIRIRTRTGHQILLHNSEDLIYITNSRGTSWIEITSNGKIDIYAQDSISVHTENDLNFTADRDINLEAGRNVNIKSGDRFQMESVGDMNILIGTGGQITTSAGGLNINTTGDNNLTASGNTNINSGGNHVETASEIHMNGPTADTATTVTALSTFDLPTDNNGGTLISIMLRVPTTEPYVFHENLDPTNMTVDDTDRESGSAPTVPDFFQQYSTATDTFTKYKGTTSSNGGAQ